MRILLLLAFGAAGTLVRYGLQGFLQARTTSTFPTGTVTVNIIGCFLVGLIGQYSLNHIAIPPEWRIAMTLGFLGAFTTFSAVGWEATRMLEMGEWLRVTGYIAASVLGGIFATMVGIRIGNSL